MKKVCTLIIVVVATCLSTRAQQQLSFHFMPEIYGRQVDGLGSFQVQNLSNDKMSGQVFITVKENTSNALVVLVETPRIVFVPGMNNFSKTVFNNSAFKFNQGSYGMLASQTRNFPPGEYTFCFKFIPDNKNVFDEQENCFDGSIQPLVPLTLINPMHQDTICNKRPLLTWQPPLPYTAGMRFRLLLIEKRSRESEAVEDLLVRRPLLYLDNISGTTLNYPAANPDLQEGKTYYWQVVAYEKGMIISKSEPWEFTVQCREPAVIAPVDSYRELKSIANGNYYIANQFLKFSFVNTYGAKKLNYSIRDLADGGPIKKLPDVNLQQGLNKIDIDLTEMNLKNGGYYALKVTPFNELPVEIRFIYKED